MENQDLSKRINSQGWITSLFGLILMIFRIILIFTIGSPWDLILAQFCMSIFCSLTGIFARKASRFPSGLNASRYASWALINLFIWILIGAFSTVIESLQFIFFNQSISEAAPVLTIWFIIYISGSFLFLRFLKTARLYSNTLITQQFQHHGRDFAPGNNVGQPVGGYQEGNAYYPAGSNVYYGQPIANSAPYGNPNNQVFGNPPNNQGYGNPPNNQPYGNIPPYGGERPVQGGPGK